MNNTYRVKDKDKELILSKIPSSIRKGGFGDEIKDIDICYSIAGKDIMDRGYSFLKYYTDILELYKPSTERAIAELKKAEATGDKVYYSQALKKYESFKKVRSIVLGAFNNYTSLSVTTYNFDYKINYYFAEICSALKSGVDIKSLSFFNEFCAVANDIVVSFAYIYILHGAARFYNKNNKNIINDPNQSPFDKESKSNVELGKYRTLLRAVDQYYYEVAFDLKCAISEASPTLVADSAVKLLSKFGVTQLKGADFTADNDYIPEEEYKRYVVSYDDARAILRNIKNMVKSNRTKEQQSNQQ